MYAVYYMYVSIIYTIIIYIYILSVLIELYMDKCRKRQKFVKVSMSIYILRSVLHKHISETNNFYFYSFKDTVYSL